MKNIELINASAGSGKTYNLTKRVLEILVEGVAPESIMVTTFTIKAAAELRERTRIQLLENNEDGFAGRIYDGFIGTVNSICARLLKEYAIEAGISPSVDTMAQEDSDRIFKISIDSVINQYASKMEGPARRLDLTGEGGGYAASGDWRNNVKDIVDYARANKISREKLQECASKSWESYKVFLEKSCDRDLDRELKDNIKLAVNHLEHTDIQTKKTQTVLDTLTDCERRIDKLKWCDWVKLSKLDAGKDGKEACYQVVFTAGMVSSHQKFHEDINQIINGCFECAIHSLEKYENYKREHGLMDFTDQETLLLDLARDSKPFRESIRDRINILMVDEFQDTSPIQLALFLALHELAGQSVWVGDPKQSIYGFRGTDPQLMEQFVSVIPQGKILDCSWRSKENLVDFTNTVFTKVFDWMGKEKVELKIPPERAAKAKGGSLEVWQLVVNNVTDETLAISNAVYLFLKRNPDICPGDIAILCRKNSQCEAIACALENLGIRASVGQGNLLDSRECRLAIAALSFMNNENDDLSLTQIISLIGETSVDGSWLTELMLSPEEIKTKWKESKTVSRLNEGRKFVRYWTPLEALEEAISRINLLREIKSWENNNLVKGNLDKLRFACREYIEQCRSQRSSATIEGFVSWLKKADTSKAKGIGKDTVNILTYHGAKGLEWPWVIMTELDTAPKSNVFGVNVIPAKVFDPANPLADRTINYWPWPFGSSKTFDLFDMVLADLNFAKDMHAKVIKEEQRLLYVGMTRAKDGLVLAIRKKSDVFKTGWLDVLTCGSKSEKTVLNFSCGTGNQNISVGDKGIPAEYFEFDASEIEIEESMLEEHDYLPVLPEMGINYPKARLSPSMLDSLTGVGFNIDETKWEIMEKFERRINISSIVEMSSLGNAVHSYLAIDTEMLSDNEKLELAKNIIDNWQLVENSINPSDVVEIGNRLSMFVSQKYPGATIFREWPMTFKTIEGQMIQGWIDMLIETPEGYVIVDHKSYPGTNLDEFVKKHVLQLYSYKLAVEKATGEKVLELLLHLPINGMVVKFGDGSRGVL